MATCTPDLPTLGRGVIVSYGSQVVRVLATDSAAAATQFGDAAATWLHALLAEIEAAGDASELLSLYGASARGVGTLLVIDVAPGMVATFAVVGDRGMPEGHGGPEWSAIRRIKLMEVEAHG